MNTASPTTYIPVGRIGSTYGIRGWLKILSYAESGSHLLQYRPWYLTSDQVTWKPVLVEESRLHGNNIIVKLPGIYTPEAARLITGKMIAIEKSQLPPLKQNEYYWSDLKGLTVINKTGERLGTVIYLIETGSNDVLVVKGTKEQAIPYLPEVILHISLEKKEILVDWEEL
jgi:16S rRNA processing protein RimM